MEISKFRIAFMVRPVMRRALYTLIFFLFSTIVVGQQSRKLNAMDSLAFDALENKKDNVTQLAEQLLSAAEKEGSALHQINAYTILGIINKNQGHYVTAVDYYKSALEVAEKSNDEGRISACYNNIGSVYQIQENYNIALEYYAKSLAIEEKLNNPLQRSIRLYNIGDIYREMDSLSLSLSHFNSSLLIEKEHKNREGIIYALLGMADIYLRLDQLTDANIVLKEAAGYIKETDVDVRIIYLLTKSELLYRENKYDEAIEAINTAKQISEEHQYKVYIVDIYEKESQIKQAKDELYKKKGADTSNNGSTLKWIIIFIGIVILLVVAFYLVKSKVKGGNDSPSDTYQSPQEKSVLPMFILRNDADKVLLEVPMNRIICFEANDNYVIIHYLSKDDKKQKSMERVSMKNIEELIAEQNIHFHRVHKSHIVNKQFVESISGKSQSYKIKMQHVDDLIPVSRAFDIEQLKP